MSSVRLAARFPECYTGIEESIHHEPDQDDSTNTKDQRQNPREIHLLPQSRRPRCSICSSAISSACKYTGFGSTFPLSHAEYVANVVFGRPDCLTKSTISVLFRPCAPSADHVLNHPGSRCARVARGDRRDDP